MKKTFFIFLLFLLLLGGCTEESRNKIFKQADNLLGKELRVSYVSDSGKIVKSWTVRDGKVTTHKDEQGAASGYYYFWSVESGYVQVPIVRTIVEEIKQDLKKSLVIQDLIWDLDSRSGRVNDLKYHPCIPAFAVMIIYYSNGLLQCV